MRLRSSLSLLLSLPLAAVTAGQARPVASSPSPMPVVQDPSVRIVENYVNPAYARPRAGASSGGHAVAVVPGSASPPGRQELSLSSCYQNTASGTFYYDLEPDTELADWGSKQCGSSNIVGKIGFGVRTTRLPVSQGGSGFRIGMRLHASGGGPGVRGALIADYTIAGDGVPFAPLPAALIADELVLPTPIVVNPTPC